MTAPAKAEGDNSSDPEPTNLARLQAMGVDPDYPFCFAMHLIEYLVEVGPCINNGMGLVAINHVDIQAWQHNSGIRLSAWESQTLRDLSLEYRNQFDRSKERGCHAPFSRNSDITDQVRKSVSVSFKSLLANSRVLRDDRRST